MDSHLIVATKGRPKTLSALGPHLAAQQRPFTTVTVVGTCEADVAPLRAGQDEGFGTARLVLADRPGLCRQRNRGLAALREAGASGLVVFWDDDFRPDPRWLLEAVAVFDADRDVAGLTGQLLADGIHEGGLAEEEAEAILAGRAPTRPVWATGPAQRDLTSAYGCNMAFRLEVARRCRFDERLPLYGWQEDRDFTGQVLAHGRVVYAPGPRGVHLGVSGGRTSGVRTGYSQVANPLYLLRKGTMEPVFARRFLYRALAANLVRSVVPSPHTDYRGRLFGNLLAWRDAARGRCRPERILEIG